MATANLNIPIQSGLILAIETSGRQGSVALAQAQPESPKGAQGAELLGQSEFSGPMRHSAEIFPAITGLLKQFGKKRSASRSPRRGAIDIEQVYISVGPGSFTGLRIAVTIAKTYVLARQLASSPIGEVSPAELNSARRTKIVAVDTLDCIAANVINFTAENAENAENNLKSNERLAVILDAKRGQFFIAVYEKTQACWEKILPDSLMTADDFLNRFADKPTCGEHGRTIALIGEGLVFYKDKFNNPAVRILDEKYWNPSASNIYRLGLQKAQRGEFADPLTLTPNYLRGAIDL